MSQTPKRHERASFLDTLADTQIAKGKLLLAGLPAIVLFLAVGAAPIVAIMAGLALALLALGPRLLPRDRQTVPEDRSTLLAGGGLLALAAGVQTVVWRLNLGEQATMALVLIGGLAVLALFAVVELARALFRLAHRRLSRP